MPHTHRGQYYLVEYPVYFLFCDRVSCVDQADLRFKEITCLSAFCRLGSTGCIIDRSKKWVVWMAQWVKNKHEHWVQNPCKIPTKATCLREQRWVDHLLNKHCYSFMSPSPDNVCSQKRFPFQIQILEIVLYIMKCLKDGFQGKIQSHCVFCTHHTHKVDSSVCCNCDLTLSYHGWSEGILTCTIMTVFLIWNLDFQMGCSSYIARLYYLNIDRLKLISLCSKQSV